MQPSKIKNTVAIDGTPKDCSHPTIPRAPKWALLFGSANTNLRFKCFLHALYTSSKATRCISTDKHLPDGILRIYGVHRGFPTYKH
jgi:hypothetical protein